MENDLKTLALALIVRLDVTIVELKKIQKMFQRADYRNAENNLPAYNWCNIMKKMLENQCDLISEKTEPIEKEYIPN
jgi:hypothetical protein